MPAPEKHYFVINQEGRSANRLGPFVSADAAKTWAKANYSYPCWVLPVEYIGSVEAKPLDEKGKPVQKG